MSTQNIHFHDKIRTIPKTSLNICFLELSKEFLRDSKNEFELATGNESSMFESLKFNYLILLII